MFKQEDISLYTKYARDKILAHKELFSPCTLEQLEVVMDRYLKSKEKNSILSQVKIDLSLLKVEKEELTTKSYMLYDFGHKTLVATAKDYVKVYFKTSAAKTKKQLEEIRKGIAGALPIMKNDNRNELNDFEDKYEAIVIAIDNYFTKKSNLLSDKDDSSLEFKNASEDWENNYNKLKDYVKGDLRVQETDKTYKDFFYEYSKPNRTSSSAKKETPEENKDVLVAPKEILEEKKDIPKLEDNVEDPK